MVVAVCLQVEFYLNGSSKDPILGLDFQKIVGWNLMIGFL